MTSEPEPTPRSSKLVKAAKIIVVVVLVIGGLVVLRNVVLDIAYEEAVIENLGGPEVVETIREADRVTAQRIQMLHPDDMLDPDEGGFNRINYEAISEPVVVSRHRAERLANWLTAGSSYFWSDGFGKGCMPTYGVKLSFHRDDHHVEVWLCFECDLFTVVDSTVIEVTPGERDRTHNFDLIHNELAGVIRALFPDDEAIQEL